jgi:hypothetical protein
LNGKRLDGWPVKMRRYLLRRSVRSRYFTRETPKVYRFVVCQGLMRWGADSMMPLSLSEQMT